MIIVLMFYGSRTPDETLPGLGFLIFSSMCLVSLLPMYALYLIKIIRYKEEEITPSPHLL